MLEPDATFRPPPWLANRHVQSILPSLPVRRRRLGARLRPVLEASRAMVLDCGDGVRLQAFLASPARRAGSRTAGSAGSAGAIRDPADSRVAVLLHGWEGSADSVYVLSLAQQLYERGFDVLRLNLRDHGDTQHLNRELFHSCRLPEVIGAMRCVQAQFPGKPLHLAGFSLGGNFMLRVAAQAQDAGLRIAKVVAVSPVLDPEATLDALEGGFSAYHRYFIRRWTRSLLLKQSAWPGDYDFSELLRTGSVRRMTAELVRRFTQFASLEEYLRGYAIVGPRLARLSIPATLITALDDPIIPARDLERLAPSAALRVIVTRRGGHCGFLERLSAWTWAERRAVEELAAPSLDGTDPGGAAPLPAIRPAMSDASPRS
jgi:uncharacterized protein